MLFTLTTTHQPATDLGFLLHKHPDRVSNFPVTAGTATVFFPKADDNECTVAMLLNIDPIALVKGKNNNPAFSLGQYVNDRPYVASSMLAVALNKVFRTAMNGQSNTRPELVAAPLPLRIQMPVVPNRGDDGLPLRLFEPLGWTVSSTPLPLGQWGNSRYVALELVGAMPLAQALNQLYVLLPVLDNSKHYWVSDEEVDKLIRAGGEWLAQHPEREFISRRYLKNRAPLVNAALDRLAEVDNSPGFPTSLAEATVTEEPATHASLANQRRAAVLAALKEVNAARVVDLGCGEGLLLKELFSDNAFTEILGVDVSHQALERAARRLRLDQLSERAEQCISLRQSALTYLDEGLRGFDAAVLMEVIEHIDEPRLPALVKNIFGDAEPQFVIVTTPNAEYNSLFAHLANDEFRHTDHRFEWTRAEFRSWAHAVAQDYGYTVEFRPIGTENPNLGAPTQLALFSKVTVTA